MLQPVKAKYGGAGLAKPSVFLNIGEPGFNEAFEELYDEHVEGFSGKSFKKMGKVRQAVQTDCICIVYLCVPVCVIEGGGANNSHPGGLKAPPGFNKSSST